MVQKLSKLFFILVSLFFVSCSNINSFSKHDFTITNNSSRNVSFTIQRYGDSVYSLAPSGSIVLSLYDFPGFNFVNNERVTYNTGFSSAVFLDLPCSNYHIENMCFHSVTITENNNMLTDTYGASVTCPAATATPDGAGGYTAAASYINVVVYGNKAPQFTAYYLDENNNRVDATNFITYVKY